MPFIIGGKMKKLCLIILSICVMLLPFPIATNATGGRTVLYLDYGDVKIKLFPEQAEQNTPCISERGA